MGHKTNTESGDFLVILSDAYMDKRTLLKLLTAVAVAGCGQQSSTTKRLRVVVAGAGIVGASIAYHLAKSGASVTVIDKQGPATHASRGTFAWVNATWAKQPRHYHALNRDSLADWRQLQKLLNLPVRWGGSLEWFDGVDRQEKLVAQIAEQVEWGEPARMVDASEFATLEPHVKFDKAAIAAYSPNDGAVDPVLATQMLLNAAERLGATVSYPSELMDASTSGGRLTSVVTSTGSIEADRLVLATGAAFELPKSIAGIDIPQRSTPGIIAVTEPMTRLLNHVIAAPGIHMHQRDDGRVVIGEQDGAPQNEAHTIRLEGRPNDFPVQEIARQHGNRMLSIAKQFVPGMADAVIHDAYVGWRPLPIDGHPVLGATPANPDFYLAIMHSGVSLAPIVGQLVAHELTQAATIERLEQFRPTRTFQNVKLY
ncbi:MAG: FAD-binding oxidoreductase [Woeseia sp.]|jgi:glycine/D-amino acid oxidase-like deaminating enzyme|nr:FAD-binding oxidoreductase [Woeseia sp.]